MAQQRDSAGTTSGTLRPMTRSQAVVRLAALIAALAVVAAAAGLFWPGGAGPTFFTTLHGQTVQLDRRGLYHSETLRSGAGNRGMDAFILVVGVPLLVLGTVLYWRGSLRGGLLLTGTLGYFLYNAVSMTFAYAYNSCFLVYVALCSASLFAFVLTFNSFDRLALAAAWSPHLPRRGIAAFLFAVGLSLVSVWLGLSILPALLRGDVPEELASSTTLVTHALDMGIVAPVAILAGVLLLRRAPLGVLLSAMLLVLSSVLGAGILTLSAAQVLAGVLTASQVIGFALFQRFFALLYLGVLTAGQVIGFVVPFIVLTLVGTWLTIVLLRGIANAPVAKAMSDRTKTPAPAAAAEA